MFIVKKEFEFSASHSLDHLPEGHLCRNNHGHNYKITVELRSRELDGQGFVIDYRELDVIKKWIDKNLDHQCLNNHFLRTTSEMMAFSLFYEFQKLLFSKEDLLYSVSISETSKTLATYVPESK